MRHPTTGSLMASPKSPLGVRSAWRSVLRASESAFLLRLSRSCLFATFTRKGAVIKAKSRRKRPKLVGRPTFRLKRDWGMMHARGAQLHQNQQPFLRISLECRRRLASSSGQPVYARQVEAGAQFADKQSDKPSRGRLKYRNRSPG
jgi:hypothetical protein